MDQTLSSNHELAELEQLGLGHAGYRNSFEMLEASIQSDNYISEGYYYRVYHIPGSGKEKVLRAPKWDTKPEHLKLLEIPASPSLKLVAYTLASLGQYQILPYLSGEPCGVSFNEINQPPPEADGRYLDHLNKIASLPIESLQHLATTLQALSIFGFDYDYGQARNLLIEDATQMFKIVDLRKPEKPVGTFFPSVRK